MTYSVKLEGALRYPDEASAQEALSRMMDGREENPVLVGSKAEGAFVRMNFEGELSSGEAAGQIDSAEFGVEAALKTAILGSVVFTYQDGFEKRMTALGHAFWQKRWDEGQIGFHEGKPNDFLVTYAERLGLAPGVRVLVPLAGKSLDLLWLAEQGAGVIGVEFSMTAIEGFFNALGLDAWAHEHKIGRHQAFSARGVTLICADLFGLDEEVLGAFDIVYDRAALIALEPSTRERYAALCRRVLKADGRILLVAFAYSAPSPVGPPWSIEEATLRELHPSSCVELLDRRSLPVSARLQGAGVKAVEEAAYLLRKEAIPAPALGI